MNEKVYIRSYQETGEIVRECKEIPGHVAVKVNTPYGSRERVVSRADLTYLMEGAIKRDASRGSHPKGSINTKGSIKLINVSSGEDAFVGHEDISFL